MRGKPRLERLRDTTGEIKSPYWYVVYYDGKRSRRVSTGYRVGQEDAEAHIALAQFILERERPSACEPAKLLVAQALKNYYEEHAKYIATAKHALYHEKRIKEHFGAHFVNQVTQAGVNAYTRKCQARGESNGTIRRDLEHLKASLNHEIREQRLIYAPKFKIPPPPPPRDKILSKSEINRLLDHCDVPHLKHFVEIMRYTGQRPGAVEGLKWFQVDFKERIIHFDRTGKQQTNKRVRPIGMAQPLYDLLWKLFKAKKTEYVLEYHDIITGKVRPAGCVKKSFKKACERAGIEGSRYTLRHTVLDAINDMADEKTASDIGGHTNTATTRRNYIKSKMEKQREVLDNLWGKSAQKVHKSKKPKSKKPL